MASFLCLLMNGNFEECMMTLAAPRMSKTYIGVLETRPSLGV
jgi:hypothetical protein